jgi:hypothetical protein
MREGIVVDVKNKRLMQNDYPSAFVGTDIEQGLATYQGMFFRRHKSKV